MTDVIFVISPTNKNSLACLCGALDTTDLIGKYYNLKLVKEEDLFEENIQKDTIFAFSFQTADLPRVKLLVKKIRSKFKRAILLAGGPHPSGDIESTLQLGFDFISVGEGEEVLINFLKNYLAPTKKFEEVKGLVFKKQKKLIFRGKAEPINLDKFLPVSPRFPLFTPIEITRGCPYGCYFCQTSYLFGRIRHRSIENIVKSAEVLVSQGWKKIRFVSPNILSYASENGNSTNLPALEKLFQEIRKVKGVEKIYAGSFPSEVRPENLNKDALILIKKYCDNHNLIIGLQSGSNSVLERMHRGHTVEQALRAIKLAIEFDFKVDVDIIFGIPQETEKELEDTIKVIGCLIKLPRVRIHGHTFMPLPGTPWAKEKPEEINKKLINYLQVLESSGRLYGDWEKQAKINGNL